MSDHPISLDLLQSNHLAILATTGAGKTYTMRGIAERMRALGWRHGVVDKLGNCWGLTVSEDGEGPGLEYVIFGGRHAHVPMEPDDGEKIATLFLEQNFPAIFDLSAWKRPQQERWVSDFADTLFHLHTEGSTHLFLDEIQSWVPQSGGSMCYDSIERLATQGRGRGIKLVMAAQRPATVSKTVLYMCTAIVAMKMVGKIDRSTIADMFEPHVEDLKKLKDMLPSLSVGQGFLWDPGAGEAKLIHLPANRTFDSSATPKHGDKAVNVVPFTSSLVEKLCKALARPDPELAADADAKAIDHGDGVDWKAKYDAIKPALDRAQADLEAARRHDDALKGMFLRLLNDAQLEIADVQFLDLPRNPAFAGAGEPKPAPAAPDAELSPAGKQIMAQKPAAKDPAPPKDFTKRPSVEKLINAVKAAHPRKLFIDDLCLSAGVSQQSSAWRDNYKAFMADGRVQLIGGMYMLTDTGCAELPEGRQASAAVAPLELWLRHYPPATQRMLTLLANAQGRVISREEIAQQCEISITSSGLKGGINELIKQGLVEAADGGWRITRDLK